MPSETMPLWMTIPAIVLFGVLVVASVVGSVLFLAGRPRSGVRRVGGSLALVCGGILLVIFFAAGIFVPVMQQARETQVRDLKKAELREIGERLHQQHNRDAGLKRLPEENSTFNPVDALVPLTNHDHPTDVVDDATQRPKWTATPLATRGDVTHVVISGQQFATVEEARHDVATAARTQLLADFQKTYGHSTKLLSDRLSDETLRTLAVRQEFVETVDRDFGNFVAPMHRVWWQVELSPSVRSELYPRWRAREQEIRTMVVAGNLVLATIGLGFLSWFTRRKPVVQSPPQPAATNPVVLGIGAATLLAKRCRQWWK